MSITGFDIENGLASCLVVVKLLVSKDEGHGTRCMCSSKKYIQTHGKSTCIATNQKLEGSEEGRGGGFKLKTYREGI